MAQHFQPQHLSASEMTSPSFPPPASQRPDFDAWAAAVKQQMLEVLERKRNGNDSQQ